MKSFQWGDNYLTGISVVDEQHQKLVDLINEMGDQLLHLDIDASEVEATFSSLASYAKYHFTEEQGIMAQVGLDKRHVDSHIESHRQFLKEVAALHSAVSPSNLASVESLLDFLIHWLAFHILVTDKNMANQIEAVNAGKSSEQAYLQEEREVNRTTEPLITALNGLFHQVSMRNKELAELNATLEQQVEDRTQELVRANAHLEALTLTDVLTKLPNRRYAMQQIALMLDEGIKNNTPVACMMIDADYFKQVNDTYGHDAGDVVLCGLSKTLLHAVRTDDVVCRLGGDEFIILCPNTALDGAMRVAESVLKIVSKLKIRIGTGAWNGSVSIGVAVNTDEMVTHSDLIKAADDAVYLAKKEGKGCIRTLISN
jgi:hemerythrin